MARLYEIDGRYLAVLDRIEAADGELEEGIERELDEIQASRTEKVESVVHMIKNLEASATPAKVESDRLLALYRSRNGAAERLKAYLHESMNRLGETKVETRTATVAVQKNPASINWEGLIDEAPLEFLINHAPTLNKTRAMMAFKANLLIGGRWIVTQGTHLRIR